MIAGIPGSGIGGIFYLLCALWMPVNELGAIVRGRSTARRRRQALVLCGFALAVVAAVWVTGWGLGKLFAQPLHPLAAAAGNPQAAETKNLISTIALAVTFGTLGGMVVSVHVLRLLLGRPARIRRRAGRLRVLRLSRLANLPQRAAA